MAEILPVYGYRFTKPIVMDWEIERRQLTDPITQNISSPASYLVEGKQQIYSSFDDLVRQGKVVLDVLPSIYILYQYFLYQNTIKCRKGFICHLHLSDWDSKFVLPHEGVVSSLVRHQEELLEKYELYLTPIHLLYHLDHSSLDGCMDAAMQHPVLQFTDKSGTENKLAIIQDKEVIQLFITAIAGLQLTLADGHHRYTAALNKISKNKQANSYITACLTNTNQNNVCLLPFHRIVSGINNYNEIDFLTKLEKYFFSSRVDVRATFENIDLPANRFGLITENYSYIFELRDSFQKEFDKHAASMGAYVEGLIFKHILHLERNDEFIRYTNNLADCYDGIKDGKSNFALINYNLEVGTVLSLAKMGIIFPEKSTYFFPKIPDGIVMTKAGNLR